ncbi:MAG: tRNA 2-thiouridine(34) synthase MnmA, partial [Leptotrichiaceae bacterium]|nr:tRNA 2-thiouridine(34) synthase MnmA [Leptotrichiaceae bacterium]
MDKLKRVAVGMSGGIDSSVAALLLKKQGYDVIGVTLKHLPDELSENHGKTCCSLDDISDAKMTCYTLGIPHYTINVVEEFQKKVMDYFVNMYHSGKTPSPCVICDEKVKISKIVEFADKMGIKYIATGHYSKKSLNGLLLWSENNPKDQSYMLYRLDKSVVERFLFPLSGYEKSEVRRIAKENGIHTHAKPDSQGICFAPDGYIPFLKNVLGDSVKKGNFINRKGEIIGRHNGYQLYTVGQRRGLGLNLGRPFFVLEIRPDTNEIVIGDFDELLTDRIEIINYKFHYKIEELLNKVLIARPRFSSKGLKGKLISETENGNERLYFRFEKKNAENYEGQHIVFYLESELIGGG